MRAVPFTLPPNVLRHFYAGGKRIAALLGTPPQDHAPEEWIGAANTTFDGSRGLSRLPDGRLVRDAIEAELTDGSFPFRPELEDIVLRCLSKAPGERPQSIRCVRDALEAVYDPAGWTAADARAFWERTGTAWATDLAAEEAR